MTSFLSHFRLVLQILPEIVALVRAIEQHAGEVPKAGAAKMELLKALLADIWAALEPSSREQISFEALTGMATKMASRFVAFFNAVGEFRKT